MDEQLLETWAIHDRINRYMLDAIPADALGAVGATRGRPVGEAFAHVHNVRLMWLKASAPHLHAGLYKVEKEQATDAHALRAALEASGPAIAQLLRESLLAGGKMKGFKPHAVAFLGYLIAHEAHHRGQIAVALKHAGHPLDKKVAFGMWEWGSR